MANILVTGGAGYIGSYMCKCLFRNGHCPVVLDDFSHGHHEAVRWGTSVEGSISSSSILNQVFARHQIDAVMHFAAFCYVGESVDAPVKYYQNNVAATIELLKGMIAAGIKRIVFSSSCATYGQPTILPISEQHPQVPISPYGHSKLMVEQILRDFNNAYGLEYTALRYFNAAGADPDGELGEDHRPETHLIPIVLQVALGRRDTVTIFGDDFNTPDGTCVRDYIHIADLAHAHLLALERLLNGHPGGEFNLGNGDGYSVKDVIEQARKITAKPIPSNISGRRPGDPASLIASSTKARQELGWKPQFTSLESIIDTAWQWHKAHPSGYRM